MISGSMVFLSTITMLAIVYVKLKNIVSKKEQEQKTIFRISTELAIGFLAFLFLLFAQFTAVHASSEQPFYLGDVFEASQYVSFASLLIPLIMILTFIEIIHALKVFTVRGRLPTEMEEK